MAETTLEDIRAAAGVSGSQVYHYFADKQALVRAVIDHQAEAVLDTQGTHLDHLDTVAGLRAWRDLLVGHQRTLQCRGRLPPRHPGRGTGRNRRCCADGRGPRVRPLGSEDPRRAAGHARPRGPSRSRWTRTTWPLATLAALQGGLLLAQVQRDPRPLEVALDAMIDRIQALTERD